MAVIPGYPAGALIIPYGVDGMEIWSSLRRNEEGAFLTVIAGFEQVADALEVVLHHGGKRNE